MMRGSVQLRQYLRARRGGASTAQAGELAGIGLVEARLHDEAEAGGEYAHIDTTEPAPIGDNSRDQVMTDITGEALRLFIERIERLEEEKKGMMDDIRDVYAEAKAHGYEPKIMRECVRLRKMERHARDERQALIETYGVQLGLF